MVGCQLFYRFFQQLNHENQIKILRNIFEIESVSVYYIVLKENGLFFRMYSKCVFYQYAFLFDISGQREHFVNFSNYRIINYYIYLGDYLGADYLDREQYPFSLLVKLLLMEDESCFYQMFCSFL